MQRRSVQSRSSQGRRVEGRNVQARAVTVATLGTLLAMISYTAPLATLRAITDDLGTGPSGQSWILSSMSLGFTAALLTCGALGDDFGRRRMFTAGAVVLALASAAGAAAPDTLVFVLGRVVQGVGTAALIACSLAVISHAVPAGPERVRASGLWGAALAAGIGSGPVVASLLPWRVTYVLVAVAALALAVAARTLLEESRSGVARPVDLPGMALLATGLACVLAGLTEGRQGLTDALPVALLAVGVLLLGGFVLVQLRSRHPMIALGLFRNPALVAATVGALVTGLGVIAVMSFLPALLQRGLGHAPAVAALLVLGWPAASVVTSLLTRRISERVPGAVRLAAGLVVVAAGIAVLAWLRPDSGIALPLAGTILAGLGTGVVNATLGRESVAGVPAHQAGMGSGTNNTSRYFGAAIGVTIVSVLSTPTGTETPAQLLDGWDRAVVVCTALTLLGAAATLACARRRSPETHAAGV